MSSVQTDPSWMARVAEMAQRSDEIAEQMNLPEVATNSARVVQLARERGGLERVVRLYHDYRALMEQVEEMQQILDDPEADADLRALATEELPGLQERRETLLDALKEKLVTGDEAAIHSIILEVRAGTGGDEAALFAGELLNMYLVYAKRMGFKAETLSLSPSDLGGVKEAIINITGEEVYLQYRFEAGGHRVQRVPRTEAQGRIHTSAATVAVLPEPEEIAVDIDWEKDVIEHVSRAGGPGGQNVNKVSSAIKLEHIATGITVSMRDEKSQHKNRARARRVLLTRVYDQIQQQQRQQIEAERRGMVGSGDRSDRIRTYNFPQDRCTDHRINKDIFGLDRILAGGEFDEFRAELHDRDLRLRLEAL
ncbi:MAG: peptide chain release factor 1 [Phycisphaerae bacterium]|jgi:peptide chain release factor 1